MNALCTSMLLLALAAAPATPAPPSAEPLRVRHVPPAEVEAGTDLVLRAEVTPAWRLKALVAHWRYAGESTYRDAPFEKSADASFAATFKVPLEVRRPLEYYVTAEDTEGHVTPRFAS